MGRSAARGPRRREARGRGRGGTRYRGGAPPLDQAAEHVAPKMQGIDQAKLVPLLVKTIQEALAEIDTLKTKVQALEDA